ncbi:MAG: heavy-metal-associated domain-containing protein [Bacteroidales bacterium]
MKTLVLLAAMMLPVLGFAQEKTVEFKVNGSCGMCKDRIEEAAMLDGVTEAEWSMSDQLLTITYNPDMQDLDAIHQNIADAGHDTEKAKADDGTYENLPACCHYERMEYDEECESPEEGNS